MRVEPRLVWVGLLMLTFACGERRREGLEDTPPPRPEGERLREILAGHIPTIRMPSGAEPPAVLLVGEDHASVVAQKRLSALLDGLVKQGLVDAVLVEGSSGTVDTHLLRAALDKQGFRTLEPTYWDGELAAGHVSAVEHLLLSGATVRCFGVEDAKAKARYEMRVSPIGPGGIASIAAHFQRAHAASRAALAAVEAAITADRAKALAAPAASLARAVSSVDQAVARVTRAIEPIQQLESDRIERAASLGRPEAQQLLETYRQIRRRADAKDGSAGSVEQTIALGALVRSHQADFDALRSDMAAIRSLDRKIERAVASSQKERARFADTLVAAQDAFFRLANALATAAHDSEGPARASAQAAAKQLGRFFIDDTRRDDDARVELRARDVAMIDNTIAYLEREHVRRAVLVVGTAHLPGISDELTRRGVRFAGGSVLDGNRPAREPWEIRAWYQRQQVTQHLFATTEYDIKEATVLSNPAWAEETAARLATLNQLEVSAPQHPGYFKTASGMALEDFRPGNQVLHVGDLLVTARVELGEQVVARGTVPGSGGGRFEVWDRDVSRRLVNELSDGRIQFAFTYRTNKGGKLEYRVVTPDGEASLAAFRDRSPGQDRASPKYVVEFAEPDIALDNGIPVSTSWQFLRAPVADSGAVPIGRAPRENVGAGPPPRPPKPPAMATQSGPPEPARPVIGDNGSGGKPPRRDLPTASGDDTGGRGSGSGDGRHGSGSGDGRGTGGRWTQAAFVTGRGFDRASGPVLLRTINPRRARENLRSLAKQKRIVPAEVSVVEGTEGLRDIPFTPTTGEHAGLMLIVARNTSELRVALADASAARVLHNKQVVLLTCGDAAPHTVELRELVLDGNARMVWVPERQLTPEIADQLVGSTKRVLRRASERGESFSNVEEMMNAAIRALEEQNIAPAEIRRLHEAGSWVLRTPAFAPRRIAG